MDWAPIVGTFCLGVVVMWLVRLFASRMKGAPQLKWLTALLSALLGGAALTFLGKFGVQKMPWPREFWFYPVGLMFGLIAMASLDGVDDQRRDERQEKAKRERESLAA